jgi:signal transduction histidine kinase/CheY-like chemotaxis protein
MKLLFVILFFSLNFFSNAVEITQIDSVAYYSKKVSFNIRKDNFKNALYFSQTAIELSKRKGDSVAISKSYATIGYVYFKMKHFNDAISSLKLSISNFVSSKPLSEKASVYYLLGLSYMELDNSKDAEIYFNKAEKIYNNEKNPAASSLLNLQKGIVYSKKGNNILARNLFTNLISESINKNDIYEVKAEALYQLAVLEFKENKNSLCLNYLNRALENNQKSDIDQKSRIYLMLSQCYEKTENKQQSYYFLKKYLKFKDSLNDFENLKSATTDYNQFKEIERLKQLNQLDRELKEKEKISRYSKLVAILAVSLISILSLLSIVLYKNNIIRSKNNEVLTLKNKELVVAKNNAEKAMKARSDFLSTVSHELRTPLNAINGITHLLIQEKPKKSQLEYLNSLKFSGNYLLTFINEILEANRIESHKVEVEKINFDLKELVNNVQNSLKEIALINNNQYNVFIDNNIPKKLIGDPTKISQILINLINNALKFTKNGKVEINLILDKQENNHSFINFKISDNGIGIPDDKLDSIFESFSQGSIEINRTYGGTGLGLTIVKNLVEILGGKINLESKINNGSTFWFVLDFENAQDNLDEISLINYDSKLLIGKNILLVEDNKINQMITKKMLEIKKISCEIVDNGEESIEKARNNQYDVILMDVHLPGINGTEATKKIREFDVETPIIALTAISLNENREMLLSFGMNDILTKPFDPEKFYEIISKYV